MNVRGERRRRAPQGRAGDTGDRRACTPLIDVRRTSGGGSVPQWPLRAGSAAVPAWSRSFDDDHHRLTLSSAPLHVGDQLVLRDPEQAGSSAPGCSTWIRRRCARDGVRRGEDLAFRDNDSAVGEEVARRGRRRAQPVGRSGFAVDALPDGVEEVGRWWVSQQQLDDWQAACAGPWWHCTARPAHGRAERRGGPGSAGPSRRGAAAGGDLRRGSAGRGRPAVPARSSW